ncbi:MAG: hypothetical protein KBI35_03895 [Ruminococcus sp.]|nr:hypothetical protein [Ruminococcus sp.]
MSDVKEQASEASQEDKPVKAGCLGALMRSAGIIALVIIFTITAIIILLLWSMGGTKYTIFGKKRTAKMEEIFGISVTDDITLSEYNGYAGFDDDQELELQTKDYQSFLDDLVKGTKLEKSPSDRAVCAFSYEWKGDTVYGEVWQYELRNGLYTVNLRIY